MWKRLVYNVILFACCVLQSLTSAQYIDGGKVISINSAPYQAALILNRTYICGATIVSAYWILTAAQCLLTPSGSFIPEGLLRVRVGADDASIASGNNDYEVNTIIKHPNFTSYSYDYDVGLLNTKREIMFDERIRCIKMADSYINDPTHEFVMVSGYGSPEPSQAPKDSRLRMVDLLVETKEFCHLSYAADSQAFVSSRMFCTASKGRTGCKNNVGGPAVYREHVVGIVSHVRQCEDPRLPSIYTDVYAVSNWIEDIIRFDSNLGIHSRCLTS